MSENSQSEQPVRPPRQRHHRLRSAEQLKLVESHRAGNAVKDLAHEFEISRQTGAATLERHGDRYAPLGNEPGRVRDHLRLRRHAKHFFSLVSH